MSASLLPLRKEVQACRRLIYSEEFTPIVQQALTGAGNLIDGVVPVLMEIIARAQDKLGPLSDEDFNTVATHLAGTLVSTAKILGDPDAEDAQSAVEGIVGKMAELAQGAEQAPEEEIPEQAPQEPPPGALAQLR